MKKLLALARQIDALSRAAALVAIWLVLICALVSAGNALSRYTLDLSSNAWLDLGGLIFFLLPFSYFMVLYSWPWFVEAWQINEISANAGGLVRWPVKLLLPLGFGLLILQGLSEIIKRVAALRGDIALDTHYERPLQ